MGKSNENFKRICKEKKIKILEVSKGTGIANSTLYEWSRGLYTPKFDKLLKIADYLNVDVTELLDDDKTLEGYTPSPRIADDCVELIDVYCQLNDSDKALLIEMAKNMKDRSDILLKYAGVIKNPTS